MAERWSPYHLRLHRWLLHRADLLPDGAGLLLAVSGGQDSMALLGLLMDLRRLHHWRLQLWHGNHQLRPNATEQADELEAWARQQQLPIQVDTWIHPRTDEAAARAWRYDALAAAARAGGVSHVVTGHTASDRAETLLLQLARGSHRRGLASLRPTRSLAPDLTLTRPLLLFSRAETALIREQLYLPLWLDASNNEARFSRNRVRQEVMPVLEQIHPGAARRISGVAERLAQEHDSQQQLVELALSGLRSEIDRLNRRGLIALQPANQRLMLQAWLEQLGLPPLPADQLQTLLDRLGPSQPPGRLALPADHWLHWDRQQLWLEP
ncbi:MAG: tRNA lysidine(34) synthetase TilS [Cyanobacteriota bacterium]|jgi:tRNA(Ile)-lysidine synthase